MRGAIALWVFLFASWVLAADPQRVPCRIALLPGAFESSSLISRWFLSEEDYFKEYRSFFESQGCNVEQLRFPADGTVEQRAFLIRERLQEGEPRWIIAHSQAGLDLRFALQTLGLKSSQLRGVVSIGTPHQGSQVATWAMDHRRRNSLFARLLRLFGYDLAELRFLPEMEKTFLFEKSKYFSQNSLVRWYFAGAQCKTSCHWGLRFLSRRAGLLLGDQLAGDGLVELESQAFGESLGEFDLDHLSEVDSSLTKQAERKRLLQRIWSVISR